MVLGLMTVRLCGEEKAGASWLVQEVLTHLGLSVNAASLEKSLWGSAIAYLLLQGDRTSLFLDV